MTRTSVKLITTLLAVNSALLFTFNVDAQQESGKQPDGVAKITIKAIDEAGDPVPDAKVTLVFDQAGTDQRPVRDNVCVGYSDSSGLYTVKSETTGAINYAAEKSGFYTSGKKLNVLFSSDYHLEKGRWEPWNPTLELILKKKENPVPMYAKHQDSEIPILGKPVGYDLTTGDYVSPYGRGKRSDFFFQVTESASSYGPLEITFSNPADGLIEFIPDPGDTSRMKIPKQAPVEGYLPHFEIKRNRYGGNMRATVTGETSGKRMSQNFIFRVRSETGEDGSVTRAIYGKIKGPFKLQYMNQGNPHLSFTFYLNPDYSRNLEFDTGKNYFKQLDYSEQVRNP